MITASASRRRIFGGVCLTLALVLLVAGQTVMKERLQGGWFLSYWLVCVVLTGLAMLTAVRDARELVRSNREEHRELIKSTIEKIESEVRPPPGSERDT